MSAYTVCCAACDGWGVAPAPSVLPSPNPPCPTCGGAGVLPLAPLDYARTSRAAAYRAQGDAYRAYSEAYREGAPSDTLAALWAERAALYAEYRRWVEGDSIAAQAGALDHPEVLS